ncbi:MAG: hypothetical protein ACLPVY_11960 [Acidimicrobiia bacterium]
MSSGTIDARAGVTVVANVGRDGDGVHSGEIDRARHDWPNRTVGLPPPSTGPDRRCRGAGEASMNMVARRAGRTTAAGLGLVSVIDQPGIPPT